MCNVNMHTRLFARKEEKTKCALTEYGGSHTQTIAVLAPVSRGRSNGVGDEEAVQLPRTPAAATLPHLNPAISLNECNKIFDFHRGEPGRNRLTILDES